MKKDPWLTLALDPFHDYSVPIQGMPDEFAEATTVQLVNHSRTITRPPFLAPGEKWDCHVFTLPINTTSNFLPSFGENLEAFNLDESLDPLSQLGQVSVISCHAGDLTLPDVVCDPVVWRTSNGTRVTQGISGTDGNDVGMSRIIGGGFEIHNDTAALYKNGSVTTYAQPTGLSDSSLVTCKFRDSGGTDLIGPCSAVQSRSPPSTVDHARSLRSAQTWEAAEGCLVPFRMDVDNTHSSFIPMDNNVLNIRPLATSDPSCSMTQRIEQKVFGSTLFSPETPHRKSNVTTSGAYFTGLDENTVLTLSCKFIMEVAPTSFNTVLLPTASPSAPYDPKILECYAHCLRKLKPSVPVSFNAKGDWWRMALKTMKEVAPDVIHRGLQLFPETKVFDAAGGGALVSSAVSSAIDLAIRRSENRNKPVKQKKKPKGPRSKPRDSLRISR